MDSEITMNYVIVFCDQWGDTFWAEIFAHFCKEKKQNWWWLTEWFFNFVLGEVRIDYWLDKYDTLLR